MMNCTTLRINLAKQMPTSRRQCARTRGGAEAGSRNKFRETIAQLSSYGMAMEARVSAQYGAVAKFTDYTTD
jgi:hypothetical protein